MGIRNINPTQHEFEPRLGYDKIIENGNGIGVTRPKPAPFPSLQVIQDNDSYQTLTPRIVFFII